MNVTGTEIKGLKDVQKITIYLPLGKQHLEKVKAAGINIVEVTVNDLKKKNDAIVADQGAERAFRLNRVSGEGHKVADGGNYFSQKENVSPAIAIQDLGIQGFVLADIRVEWKQTHGNGRLALEFQRNPKEEFITTLSQRGFYLNLLMMAYAYMHPYLNAPSAVDPQANMTFNFAKRLGSENAGTKHLRIGPPFGGKFFACCED